MIFVCAEKMMPRRGKSGLTERELKALEEWERKQERIERVISGEIPRWAEVDKISPPLFFELWPLVRRQNLENVRTFQDVFELVDRLGADKGDDGDMMIFLMAVYARAAAILSRHPDCKIVYTESQEELVVSGQLGKKSIDISDYLIRSTRILDRDLMKGRRVLDESLFE